MEQYDPRTDLRALWRFLRARGWIVLLCAVVGGAAGLAASYLQPREYEASTTVLVQADPLEKLVGLSDDFSSLGDPTLPGSAIETQLQLVRQRSLAAGVRRSLGSSRTPAELLERVRGERDTATSLIRVVARESSAAGAARLANAWTRALVADMRTRQRRRLAAAVGLLRTELGQTRSGSTAEGVLERQLARLATLRAVASPPLRVVEPAVAGGAPVSPRRAVALSIGILIGLVAGLGVALVLHLGPRETLSAPRREDAAASA